MFPGINLSCLQTVDRTVHSEEPYGIQLNGGTHHAPPWPEPQFDKENMFLLPKQLNSDDSVTVSGNLLRDPRIMTVGLLTGYNSPDYQNIACQLEINFPSNNGQDQISIKVVQNGQQELVNDSNQASQFFVESDFSVRFGIREHGYLDIYLGQSFLEQFQLKHNVNDIRFITVSGDVEKVRKLDFEFS